MENFMQATATGHEPMKLRAHHLVCILGFRGLGYSKEYVDNMTKIVEQLRPSTLIQIASEPDDICAPCPFLGETGCRERGPESEAVVSNRDLAVMERLGIVAGDRMTWADVKEGIRCSIRPEDLVDICQDCQWLPQGYCEEGLRRLRG